MAAPAGWYADPQDPQTMRYFDGTSWTTQTQPVAQQAHQAQQAQQAQQPGYTQQSQQRSWQGQTGQQGQQGQQIQQTGQSWQPQQPGQAWQGRTSQTSQHGQGQTAQSPQAQQPAQRGGFQFGGAQQIPTEDRPTTGTPRGVKMAIAGAAVGVVAVMGLGYVLSDSTSTDTSSSTGVELRETLPRGYDRADLSDDAILASEGNDPANQVTATGDLSLVYDNIDDVKVPELGESMLVISCGGEVTFGDGTTLEGEIALSLEDDGYYYVGLS